MFHLPAAMRRRRLLTLFTAAALIPAMTHARPSRPLVVYLSRSGNTRAVAEIITEQTGGILFALEPQPPYPRDYQAQVAAAAKELADGSGHPLAAMPDLTGVERIYLGWPTWAMQLPSPVQTFLRQADLGGKTLCPFNTHAGYGVGDGFATLARLAPQSRILPGLSVEGGYEKKGILLAIQGQRRAAVARTVRAWLNS
ncbi:flavodoxin [uncultured Cardiobacterium sp.]|uniref:flavodoxin n=1 Tax=uncultured Cardiobacterium sp. TaxID=417619 RepID=UPI002615B206|nr:flavodoxin [uncultured Cardiobacterium sp.]